MFHWAAKTEGSKAESGGGVLGEGQHRRPHQLAGLGGRCGVRDRALTTQRFPLFSALRMASPDSIKLLIVDYHAAIVGCQDPHAPPPPIAHAHVPLEALQ